MGSATNGIPSGPTHHTPLRVVIIGGGFSGTLVAIHLLRQSDSVQVHIVDERVPGRGLAYSTTSGEHLLNVPALRMSAFGSEPLHFLNWLHSHGNAAAGPDLFAPRRFYGTYIQDLLETSIRSAGPHVKLQHHFSAATQVSFDGESGKLLLKNGVRLKADRIVLALGNASARNSLRPVPGYFSSPWLPQALSGIDPQAQVLLVGAALTAVDAFLALVSQGHTGEIHVLSRRGKLPQFHQPYRPLPQSFMAPATLTARSLLKAIRLQIKNAQAQDIDWRAVIDSTRPVTNEIWQQLAPSEQSRIFRHLKTWWDIHRHRMAPEIGAKVQSALDRKQLIVHAGRLRGLTPADGGLRAEIQLRTGSPACLNIQRVVNCTGPDNSYKSSDDPLIQNLLESGYATPGKIGRGFHTAAHGALIDAQGRPSDWLLTLGPPRLGDLLETIAVPELRRQAEALANHLLSVDSEPYEVQQEVFLAAGI